MSLGGHQATTRRLAIHVAQAQSVSKPAAFLLELSSYKHVDKFSDKLTAAVMLLVPTTGASFNITGVLADGPRVFRTQLMRSRLHRESPFAAGPRDRSSLPLG